MDRNEVNLLIDYYGDLLTSRQLQILTLYYFEDLSMNEIAENLNISKAAVSDVIKKSTKQLLLYEEKLKFIAHDSSIEKILEEMDAHTETKSYAERIRKILKG